MEGIGKGNAKMSFTDFLLTSLSETDLKHCHLLVAANFVCENAVVLKIVLFFIHILLMLAPQSTEEEQEDAREL